MPFDASPEIDSDLAILLAARAKIEHHWIQKRYQKDGGYCLVGAVNATCRERNHGKTVRRRIVGRLATALGFHPHRSIAAFVVKYNDLPHITKDQVLNVITVAINERLKELTNAV